MRLLISPLFTTGSSLVFADVSNSHPIKNTNRKNYCLAMNHKQATYCYSMKDGDEKNYFLAQVHSQRMY